MAACDGVLALVHGVQGVAQGVHGATHVLRQRRHIGKAVHGTGRLCFTKVREVLGKGEQAVVEHIPRRATRLRQHMHCRFGVALGFVMKARTKRIDLHATFHHQGPRDQRALRHSP